jgi:hypothetical protein
MPAARATSAAASRAIWGVAIEVGLDPGEAWIARLHRLAAAALEQGTGAGGRSMA